MYYAIGMLCKYVYMGNIFCPPLYQVSAKLLNVHLCLFPIFQELQAKLAAQKLADGLSVGMNSYNPEGAALAAYREVHDDGALSEED